MRCGTIVTHARITICIHIVSHPYLGFLDRAFYDLGGHFWASDHTASEPAITYFVCHAIDTTKCGSGRFSWTSVPRCLLTSFRYLAPAAMPSSRPHPISPRPPHPPCAPTAAAAAQWRGKGEGAQRGFIIFQRPRVRP